MRNTIAREVWPFAGVAILAFGGSAIVLRWLEWSRTSMGVLVCGLVVLGFLFYFFRDPERPIEAHEADLLSGADGVVRTVEEIAETRFLKADTIRISVFLNIFNVHINRSPMAGELVCLQYTPGRKLFAFLDSASEYNEHNSIWIKGAKTQCLVRQIVGPVARRVVCWHEDGASLAKGERLGIMKFGSRLDVYFLRDDVEVLVKKGDRVTAGQTVVAWLKG